MHRATSFFLFLGLPFATRHILTIHIPLRLLFSLSLGLYCLGCGGGFGFSFVVVDQLLYPFISYPLPIGRSQDAVGMQDFQNLNRGSSRSFSLLP